MSPLQKPAVPVFNESNSLDSCLFEIFHSKDGAVSDSKKTMPTVDIKRPEKIDASPPKKMKSSSSSSALQKPPLASGGKVRVDRTTNRKQRDIRYYFKKNSKVKIITYTDHAIPMDASPVPLERSGHEWDTMDIEYTTSAKINFAVEDFSDMEIEHLFLRNSENKEMNEDMVITSQPRNINNNNKLSKSLSLDEGLSTKARESIKEKVSSTKVEDKVRKNSLMSSAETLSATTMTRSVSFTRDRSPLKLPSKDQEPVKFVRTLHLFNSRKILKPISLRFRRYTSMIEMSSSYKAGTSASTPNFRKSQNERVVRTEPRNKRKISNPRELFDDLDKYDGDTPTLCKKARKSIITTPSQTSVSLPPSIKRIPLFKPTVESRCYGDVDLGVQPLPSTKECASCCTSETLIWRDTEDGVSLCNACGIRWRKYHYRCVECWYVPMQDELDQLNCASCGKYSTLKKFSSLKRHKTTALY